MQAFWVKWVGRLALVGLGIIIAVGMLYGLLAAFPQLLPQANERQRNQTMHVSYYLSDGDLFYHQPGEVKPPPEDVLLSEHVVNWDGDGFRVPAMTTDSYPIITLGDSFTEGWMVPSPWPDVLATELNTPVRNLSYRGYGPIEERKVMEEYGEGQHQWVIVAFFEGNDLQNIATSLTDADNPNLTSIVRDALQPERPKIVESPDGNYKYPLALYIGSDFYEQAFYEFYLWVLNADKSTYDDSRNLREFVGILGDIKEMAGDACVGVVYLPSKEHIYFPYAEPFGRRWVLEQGVETFLDEEGWLSGNLEAPAPVEFDQVLSRLDNMRDSVGEAVTVADWHFIDLTPAFQDAAAQSQMLYLTYDTHWNQAGQTLAGQVVAQYLQTQTNCTP